MKNLIIIMGENTAQFDDINGLKEFILKDWKVLKPEEIEKTLYQEVFGISRMMGLQIVSSKRDVMGDNYEVSDEAYNPEKAIYIDTIELYLLSLCKFNIITILEEKANRVFTKDINVNAKDSDNYIIVNAYANEILKDMVGDTNVG